MKKIDVSVVVSATLAICWLVVILLNFNGFFIPATNILFYLFSIVFFISLAPHLRYLIFRSRSSDWAEEFKSFVRNGHRYIFIFFSIPVIFYCTVNAIYDPLKQNSDIVNCLTDKRIVVDKRGLLNISSFKMTKSELVKLRMCVFVQIGQDFKRLRVEKNGGIVKCFID